MTGATSGADRGVPKVRVLFGTERFSSQHSWSELTAVMPAALRQLPESPSGFDPGRWGDPLGEALAGSTVCIVGLGAVGSQLGD